MSTGINYNDPRLGNNTDDLIEQKFFHKRYTDYTPECFFLGSLLLTIILPHIELYPITTS